MLVHKCMSVSVCGHVWECLQIHGYVYISEAQAHEGPSWLSSEFVYRTSWLAVKSSRRSLDLDQCSPVIVQQPALGTLQSVSVASLTSPLL